MEEITLEEPVKKERRGGYILLGVVVGLVIGIAVGYYVNVGTLQYAYKLLLEAQATPPDIYLVAYATGKSLTLTPMGTLLLAQPLGLNDKVNYIGDAGGYSVFISSNYVYVVKGAELYSRMYFEEIRAASVLDSEVYVGAKDGVYKLGIPELDERASVKINDVRDLVVMLDTREVYLLTGDKLYILTEDLKPVRELAEGGDRLFVGAYYFFIARGNRITSYDRSTGRQISSTTVGGEVNQLRACRGILLAVTSDKTYALRVPDLALIKIIDAGGLKVRADPSCGLAYIIKDHELYMVLIPSLNIHTIKLDTALDDVVIRSGAAGAAVQLGGKRQIALACGG